MPNERTPYLQDLIKYSKKATLLIHNSFINGMRSEEEFELTNNALNYLKNDDKLSLTVKGFDDGYIEITVSLKGDEGEDNV